MESEQLAEFHELQAEAIRVLRQGQHDLHPHARRIMHLLQVPTFTPSASFQIYREHGRDEPAVQYVVVFRRWDRDVDYEKFRTPVERLKYPHMLSPTLTRLEYPIDADYVEARLRQMTEIRISPVPHKPQWGVDGVHFAIEIGDFWASSHIEWWGYQGPPAWRELTQVFHEMLDELRRLAKQAEEAS